MTICSYAFLDRVALNRQYRAELSAYYPPLKQEWEFIPFRTAISVKAGNLLSVSGIFIRINGPIENGRFSITMKS